MKKVIHVITTISRGGAENQLLTLAHEQITGGWNVSVLYLKDSPDLIEDFGRIGVEVITDCANYSVIRQILWLRIYFKKNKGIIHAHLPRAELLTALAARKHSFVISRHNAEGFFPSAPAKISSLLSRFVTRRARAGIAISKAVEIYIKSRNEISKNCDITIIHYGFENKIGANNLQKLNRSDINLNENDYIFGTVGRIVPQKDYPTLLIAFSAICEQREEYKLLIIGDGYLKEEMKELAFKLGISPNVIWLGRTDRIVETLKLMDCFVLASSYEGFGLVLLEAMSARIPIIASNISAIPEVLGNEHTLLSIAGDSGDFANKMSQIISFSTDELSTLLDFQSKQLNKFDPFLMNKSIEKIYSLIGSI